MSGNRSRKLVRQSRALGIALSPKAEKYMQRRSYRPGEHGRGRVKDSDYSVRLKEKQRLRAQYGIREAQMKRVWEEARRAEGLSGENLVELLEMRLDALALRAGFARTIAQARQVVVHRHLLVDGKIVDRPSYRVRPGQVVRSSRAPRRPPSSTSRPRARTATSSRRSPITSTWTWRSCASHWSAAPSAPKSP